MPRNVEEWDRRRNHSISLSAYHVWVIDSLVEGRGKRDRSQIVAGLLEAEAERLGSLSVADYLCELEED